MFIRLLEITISAVWIAFFIISMKLFKFSKRNFHKQSYSLLGSDKKYGYIFNILLIITGSAQLLIFIMLRQAIMKSFGVFGQLGYILLCITTLLGIGTGIFPIHSYRFFHKTIAAIGFLSAGIGWILIGIHLFSQNIMASSLFLVFGGLLVPSLIPAYFHHKHDLPAVYESMFFLSAFVTDILMLRLASG